MEETTSVGRPTIYTSELAEDICNCIGSSNKGIKRLCNENPQWPCKDTIFTWRKTIPEFSDRYAEAKRHQAEFFVDEILETVYDPALDNLIAINRARLQVDTLKWLACKLAPKLYGNHAENQETGLINPAEALRDLD